MAHVKHFTKYDLKNVLKEQRREADHYKNEVDPTRTHLNMTFKFKDGINGKNADELRSKVKARAIDIVGKEPQSQTNLISNWVVTYPRELCDEVERVDEDGNVMYRDDGKPMTYFKPQDMDHCKKFFKTVARFTSRRYGVENMLPVTVHMDETTPHGNFPHMPVCKSRKTGKETVSSASIYNKRELQGYQRDLQKQMVKVFGNVAKEWVLNGKTKLKNGDIETLKEVTKVERMDDIDAEIRKRVKIRDQKAQEIETLDKEIEDLKAKKAVVETEKADVEAEKQKVEEARDAIKDDLTEQRTSLSDTLKKLSEAETALKDVEALRNEMDVVRKELEDIIEGYKDIVEKEKQSAESWTAARTIVQNSYEQWQIKSIPEMREAKALKRFAEEMETQGDKLKYEWNGKDGKRHKRTAKGRLNANRKAVDDEEERLIAEAKERERKDAEREKQKAENDKRLNAALERIAWRQQMDGGHDGRGGLGD